MRLHHIQVLKALYKLHVRESHYVWTFSTIAEEVEGTVLKSDVRRIVRYLKRKGYVEYTQCFSEDDYQVNGSGHIITAEGIRLIKELPE